LRLACVHWLPPELLYADFLYRFPPLRVDALLLGALVALCLRGEESGRVLRSGGVVALGAAGVLASLLAGVALRTHHAPSPSVASGWMSTIGFTLIDLLSAGVIVLALKPAGLLFRVLTAKPLRRLGQMSYGFYIFHFLLQGAFLALARYWFGDRLRHLNVAVAGIGMVGSLAISYVSFRFFETPFLRLKDRFTA
jgi:peptidoglycan/LPS O-acetylase OafA/YrhL